MEIKEGYEIERIRVAYDCMDFTKEITDKDLIKDMADLIQSLVAHPSYDEGSCNLRWQLLKRENKSVIKSYATWVKEFCVEGKRITRIAFEFDNGTVSYLNE